MDPFLAGVVVGSIGTLAVVLAVVHGYKSGGRSCWRR